MTYGRPPDSVPVDQFPAGPHTSVGVYLETLLTSSRLFYAYLGEKEVSEVEQWSDRRITRNLKSKSS